MLCALVCGLLTGAAAVLYLGCPSAPPAAPSSQSSYGSSGTGCWTEGKADGDVEKICGAMAGRAVTA